MKNNILCIIMNYSREYLLDQAIQQVRESTAGCDIVIWNNGPDIKNRYDDIDYFQGINEVGLTQRFLPALVYPHEYVFFLDEDIILGKRFVENAIDIIIKNPKAAVTSAGSVMHMPVNDKNIDSRISVYGKNCRNKENIPLDMGCIGCVVIRREHVNAVFRSAIIPHFLAEEYLFFMSHVIYNDGSIILPRHDEGDLMGIREYDPAHRKGLNSQSDFFSARKEQYKVLSEQLGWQPSALQSDAWKPGGHAFTLFENQAKYEI